MRVDRALALASVPAHVLELNRHERLLLLLLLRVLVAAAVIVVVGRLSVQSRRRKPLSWASIGSARGSAACAGRKQLRIDALGLAVHGDGCQMASRRFVSQLGGATNRI